MSIITVLGGCGVVGSVAVKTLCEHSSVSRVVVADYNIEAAEKLVAGLKSEKLSAVKFDAMDRESVREAIRGSDVVLNCVGPFYSTVKSILGVVIEEKINYVDICDDVDVTLEVLEMDGLVKEAGITALIGMGSSPGVTNIIARLAADTLLDSVDSIDIFHTHGGEPVEGPGVIGHRFHCMSIPVPMFLGGKLKYVDYFGEDGIALRENFTFPMVGETLLYPYPHPEQITIPKYIKTQQVTNKGSVLPEEYYNMIRDLCHLGLSDKEPLMVKGQSIVPAEFAIAYIIRERERILQQTNFGGQRGCASVIVKGTQKNSYCEYRFHMASTTQALGEGTGIPAAVGALMMVQGKVAGKGLAPPEALVDPRIFLTLIVEIMARDASEKGGEFKGFLVEKVDEHGVVTRVDL